MDTAAGEARRISCPTATLPSCQTASQKRRGQTLFQRELPREVERIIGEFASYRFGVLLEQHRQVSAYLLFHGISFQKGDAAVGQGLLGHSGGGHAEFLHQAAASSVFSLT